MMIKNTKIICTLGPTSDEKETIEKMVKAGMTAARLNFSHGTYKNFSKIIKNVRAVSKKLDRPITIIQDLQGPKIRVGNMPEEGIIVKKGDTLTLTSESITGNQDIIPVQYKQLPKEVKKGDTIMLCDGIIELKVLKVEKKERIVCRVVHGGEIKSNKGINVPTTTIKAPPLTAKDKKDLEFGLKNNVDYVALSFVKNGKEINALRERIKKHKKDTKIIAKVERHEAIANLEEIIEASDAIMVARGDLGTEIGPERVPLIQKKIIKLANIHAIPVITATEMLQSMVTNARATRAEVSDAANAVLDHTDALMLSNETAVGKFPVEAVKTLSKTAKEVEHFLRSKDYVLKNKIRNRDLPILNSLCYRACQLANDTDADLIVVITKSGHTARQVMKHRPYIPVVTITASNQTLQELNLVWGINDIQLFKNAENPAIKKITQFLIKKKLVKKGHEVVICNASKKESFINTTII